MFVMMLQLAIASIIPYNSMTFIFDPSTAKLLQNVVVSFKGCGCVQLNVCRCSKTKRQELMNQLEESDSTPDTVSSVEYLCIIEEDIATLDSTPFYTAKENVRENLDRSSVGSSEFLLLLYKV